MLYFTCDLIIIALLCISYISQDDRCLVWNCIIYCTFLRRPTVQYKSYNSANTVIHRFELRIRPTLDRSLHFGISDYNWHFEIVYITFVECFRLIKYAHPVFNARSFV